MHIYTDRLFAQHEVPSGHPERGERISTLLDFFHASGLTQDHPLRTPKPVSDAAILRAHPQTHLDFLVSLSTTEAVPVDPDTWLGPHSLGAARAAAGAACDGVNALLDGATKRVFCAVRPPGHHAERDSAMGFCLFNSIAIGALEAMRRDAIERVAILDFDVHHGNGTVDIFKDNPAVLVCSSFQHPHYPNRHFDLVRPNIINTPMDAGTDGQTFRHLIERDWLPALEKHRPQLILISAGFDAHQADPLAAIDLLEADYAWITRFIVNAAQRYSEGRILSILEGGYDLQALQSSVEAHLTELA